MKTELVTNKDITNFLENNWKNDDFLQLLFPKMKDYVNIAFKNIIP